MQSQAPSPERIMQFASGCWASAILATAVKCSVFNHLEDGQTVESVAEKARISPRGAQALLDGLMGLGLVTLDNGVYRNTPDSSTFLVAGKQTFLGGFAEIIGLDMNARWASLPDVVKMGVPQESEADKPENPFWEKLVPSIAALSAPVVALAAKRLGLSDAGPVTWLDVGGGSGIFSAIWLGMNPQAQGYQLDWPNVNRIAKEFVVKYGVVDRFHTIDGDFHQVDFGEALYDYAVYSHIAHQESPRDNERILTRFRRALKPGGTLVINDFILNDDRTGNAFALMFHSNMLLVTKEGASWRRADYETWLTAAGFTKIEFVVTQGASTLVFAS